MSTLNITVSVKTLDAFPWRGEIHPQEERKNMQTALQRTL